MATTSNIKKISGGAQADFADDVTYIYEVQYDAIPTSFHSALTSAQAASSTPVPARAAPCPSASWLFAGNISGEPDENQRTLWTWTVSYTKPSTKDLGSLGPGGEAITNPLLRPAVYNIEYMDIEQVIEKAYNVDSLPRGSGKGTGRAALTLGPVVNSAGERPDEPQMTTKRLEVLVIQKNFATLAAIVNLNRTYKDTTNSDNVQGYQPRELRYQLTESSGQQKENNITFWPGTTTILAEDSTDLVLDNVGTKFWDGSAIVEIKETDEDGNSVPPFAPVPLKLDGTKGGDYTTTITYRYLSSVAYVSLF